MTVGVPVIASDRGALPEVLGDAGLLVSPRRSRGAGGGDAARGHGSRLAATLGARGARRSQIFDWNAAAVTLREIYEALTTAARGHRGQARA
jgi:glycosyltransferase involved in cell wall biosynthesis